MRTSDYTLILASYYPKNRVRTIKFCEQFENCTKIVVCNSSEIDLADFGDSWITLHGSNTAGEFSAWQEGLEFSLSKLNKPKHGYIFLNDTVNSHRNFSFIRLNFFKKHIIKYKDQAVGFTDTINNGETFSIHGLSGKKWISTYCFYLGLEAIEKIDFIINSEKIYPNTESSESDSLFPSSMSENLKNWLDSWLFGGGWYKSKTLDKKKSYVAKFKARAIINEKILSLRLINNNVEIESVMDQIPRIALRLDNLIEKIHQKIK